MGGNLPAGEALASGEAVAAGITSFVGTRSRAGAVVGLPSLFLLLLDLLPVGLLRKQWQMGQYRWQPAPEHESHTGLESADLVGPQDGFAFPTDGP